jgi:hypothetical protein
MKTIYGVIEPPYYKVLFYAQNRETKRKFAKETEIMISTFLPIEMEFLGLLFDENGLSYMELFTAFNTIYKDECDRLKKEHNFEYLKLKPDYFYKEYYPHESKAIK